MATQKASKTAGQPTANFLLMWGAFVDTLAKDEGKVFALVKAQGHKTLRLWR